MIKSHFFGEPFITDSLIEAIRNHNYEFVENEKVEGFGSASAHYLNGVRNTILYFDVP